MQARVTLGLLVCLAVPLAESAPKPKGDDKPALYLPTTVGDKRVLEQTINGTTSETTEWVTAVETKDGMTVVSFSSEEGGPTTFQHGASADGLFGVATGAMTFDPPHRLLKLPAKEGETWEAESPGAAGGAGLKLKYTTGKEEVVEVPAGKFKAVRVEAEYLLKGEVNRITYWYAPGASSVKVVIHDQRGDLVLQLKSLTSGGKK